MYLYIKVGDVFLVEVTKTFQKLLHTTADLRRKKTRVNLRSYIMLAQCSQQEQNKPPLPSLLFFWPSSPAAPRDIFVQELKKKKTTNKKSCDLPAESEQ